MRHLTKTIVLATLLGTVVACGKDDPRGPSNRENTGVDTRSQGVDTGTADTGGFDTRSDTDTGEQIDRTLCLPEEYMPLPANVCSGSNSPARCEEDPSMFDGWGPASVVTQFEISDADCCFDINREEGTDNVFGTLLSIAGNETAEPALQQMILDDRLIYLLEYHDLSSAGAMTETPMSIHRGAPANQAAKNFVVEKNGKLIEESGHAFEIQPSSLAAKAQSKGWFPSLDSDGSTFQTDRGRMWLGDLPPGFFIAPENIEVVKFRADIDEDRSDISGGTGVAVNNGKIGGYARVTEILDSLNEHLSNCKCLGDLEDPIGYETESPGDPDIPEEPTCDPKLSRAEGNACKGATNIVCRNPGTTCGVAQIAASQGDVDSDCDGRPDSLSIGVEFKTAGAVLRGIGD